ncbi:MAG: hypothetical protein CSB44_00140 [Gammaproteobacteria bacterium]|nr:MAG: hypothetical protein CSB44_00140 [Gammaproteobacteria bacterium]
MIDIRPARFDDYPRIISYDVFLGDRRLDIQRGELYVCDTENSSAVGYMKITRNQFLDWPLLAALCVDTKFRRRGFGTALLNHAQGLETAIRMYLSTETGNKAMLRLLEKAGAQRIGYLDKLNLNDERELFFRLK